MFNAFLALLRDPCCARDVVEQHCHGHRPDASWHRGDCAGDGCNCIEIDVSDQSVAAFARGIVDAIDADIDHGGASMNHIGGDRVGPAGRGDENVGLPCDGWKVGGVGVADGDGGVRSLSLLRQHRRQGHSDKPAASDDDHVLAARVGAATHEQLLDAVRSRRQVALAALQDAALIGRMQAVDILEWIDPVEQGVGVDAFGRRQLQNDAVDIEVGVEQLNAVADPALGLHRIRIEVDPVNYHFDAGLFACSDFAPNVGGGRRIVADQDHSEVRKEAAANHVRDLPRQRISDAGGDRCAINDRGCHAVRV